MVDHHNPTIKLVLHGQEITGCIIDEGSGVNVISAKTCEQLGISEWEACPFCLRMEDTGSVRPLGLIRKLGIIIDGHHFDISAVVLALDAPGAYPILLADLGCVRLTSNRAGNIIVSVFDGDATRFVYPPKR